MYYLAVNVSAEKDMYLNPERSDILIDQETGRIFQLLFKIKEDIDVLIKLRNHLNNKWQTNIYRIIKAHVTGIIEIRIRRGITRISERITSRRFKSTEPSIRFPSDKQSSSA